MRCSSDPKSATMRGEKRWAMPLLLSRGAVRTDDYERADIRVAPQVDRRESSFGWKMHREY